MENLDFPARISIQISSFTDSDDILPSRTGPHAFGPGDIPGPPSFGPGSGPTGGGAVPGPPPFVFDRPKLDAGGKRKAIQNKTYS